MREVLDVADARYPTPDAHTVARELAADTAWPDVKAAGGKTDWPSPLAFAPLAPSVPGLDMSWTDGAACAGLNPDDWFPVVYTQAHEDARRVCLTCPCVVACRQHGLDHERYGTWGGLTPQDRQRVRRGVPVDVVVNRHHKIDPPPAGRPLGPIRHGSEVGYKQHRARGLPMCDDCRDGKNRAERDRRASRNGLRLVEVDG